MGRGFRPFSPFREPLMVSLSSVMIVVVAAEIRLTEVRELGWPGVFLVMALVLILRPASLFVSTRSSDLRGKEKSCSVDSALADCWQQRERRSSPPWRNTPGPPKETCFKRWSSGSLWSPEPWPAESGPPSPDPWDFSEMETQGG